MIQTIYGCSIRFERRDNDRANALPVLFLHGWGCDGNIYKDLMLALENSATLLTLDFPAHGESAEPPQPWGVSDFAALVLELLDKQGIETVDIVSHSFGARVAIYLAANHPQRVRQLVITGGAGI